MAILKNAFLSIGGTDHSATVQSITTSWSVEQVDDTAMGDDSRSAAGGLKNWSISGVVHWAAGASSIDADLSALLAVASAGTAALIVRPDSGVVSTTNPQWAGTGLLTDYEPVAGAVGDQHTATFTFTAAGDLTRTTA